MWHFCLLLAFLPTAGGLPVNKSQALVDYINSQNKWVARQNPQFEDLSKLKQLMGTTLGFKSKNIVNVTDSGEVTDALPKEFDARTNWPICKNIIGRIVDQSECGSCWAVSSASVISDRLCIASKGTIQTFISAADVMSCCTDCGTGCGGGNPDQVFDEWSDGGFVSGSDYVHNEGCKPYVFAPCQHHGMYYTNSSLPACPSTVYDTPKCLRKCQAAYKTSYEDDKFYGHKEIASFQDVPSIQREIMRNGPVVAVYSVYDDFGYYVSGIYEKTSNTFIGYHSVRIIGWGEENGTPYWLIANSWNSDWGENGFFRIRRGTGEAQIERLGVVASIPDINRSAKLYIF